MLADRYGLPVSTASSAALEAYVAGVDTLLAAHAGYREHFERAIAADPRFALAHVALARGLFLDAEAKPARESAATARALAQDCSDRERSHVDALALTIEGKPVEALAATRAHLALFPRDAMVLAPATGVFGLIGFSGRADREEEHYVLLAALAPHYGEDWWFLCALAFAAVETGRIDEAARLIERSLGIHPRNAHGAHVRAHVLYETGETAQALAFLDGWMPGYPRSALLHCHLSWHVALSALALDSRERAWEVYRASVHPGASWGPPINALSDAASFLWRSELAGGAREPQLWSEVRDYALRCFPKAGLAFADVHAALACAATGDAAALDRLTREMGERLAAGRLPAGPVVTTLVEAFAAYANGDAASSVRLLEQARAQTVRIGGSRAQRDLIEHTLLAAYLRADRPDPARALLAGRERRRPRVPVAGIVA